MFEVSFGELMVIGVVALIVLGPERLPKVARTAGILVGRLQRYIAGVKADLMKEVEASELHHMKQQVQHQASEIQADLKKEIPPASSSTSQPKPPSTP